MSNNPAKPAISPSSSHDEHVKRDDLINDKPPSPYAGHESDGEPKSFQTHKSAEWRRNPNTPSDKEPSLPPSSHGGGSSGDGLV